MKFLWRLILWLLGLFGIDDGTGSEETPSFCGCSDCSATVMGADAFGETCSSRIKYLLIFEANLYPNQVEACRRVASIDYPTICGPACDPTRCDGRTPDPPIRTSGFCGCNDTCTLAEWQSVADPADGLSCQARITWLQAHVAQFYADERPACYRTALDLPSSSCARACNPIDCGWSPSAPIALYCFPDDAQRVSYIWGSYMVQVKERDEPCGPGYNKFGRETVYFYRDSLTLRFARVNGLWQASEVRIVPNDGSSFQYGTFRFRVDSVAVRKVSTGQVIANELPPSLVLGAFTWDDTDDYSIRENYNKEVSRWNDPNNADGQFLVQPDGSPQKKRFFTGPKRQDTGTTQQGGHSYEFTWGPGSITWSTTAGGGQRHEYSAELALAEGREDLVQCLPATNLDVRINLWNMLSGNSSDPPPGLAIDEDVVVVLSEFSHSAMTARFRAVGARCSKDCNCEAACVNGVCAPV
jgi:hypothetical protein